MTAYYLIRDVRVPIQANRPDLKETASLALDVPISHIESATLVKESIDARKRSAISWLWQIEVVLTEPLKHTGQNVAALNTLSSDLSKPQGLNRSVASPSHPVIVVGSGPAGLFCALALADAGVKTQLIERGQPVEPRMRDIGQLRSKGVLNPESNVCFGEGGAGTYTDGKLYTRIKHPFVKWVMGQLVQYGAPPQILVDAHPHLGTDRLMRIIQNIRHHLLDRGVDIQFNTRMDVLLQKDGRVAGIRDQTGKEITGDRVVLAIGHSARDTFNMLHEIGVAMEPKSFAVGVRAEHPQNLINQAQYGDSSVAEILGAAEYRLTCQVETEFGTRGVYSFCMCPGGLIVPTPTEPGQMVVNGMSNANRSARFANSGIVVQVEPEDLVRAGFENHPLMGLAFQQQLESRCYAAVGQPYFAPAMTIEDFLANRHSGKLLTSDFRPGIQACDLNELLPPWLVVPMRTALRNFGRKIKGYETGMLLAVESRSSSPLRITRGIHMQSINTKGLYPVGEGAGYAGGIISAAVDGLKAAEQILTELSVK
ncbi:MAG: FAD-binding protein [Acidobacteria bacterium]|nr:FAD-binding protein [Acidobacteriota bacterium]